MRGTILRTDTELVTETCPTCGLTFAMPKSLWETRRDRGGDFYCPSGHQMAFIEPEVTRLKRERDKAVRELTESQWEVEKVKGQLDGALDTISKQRKRTNAGVCPHCRRNFANVRRHIETKHPEELCRAA